MRRYVLEFVLDTHNASLETIRNSLVEFGDCLQISRINQETAGDSESFKIQIQTEEPTAIFDICSEFGRIKSVKINENGG